MARHKHPKVIVKKLGKERAWGQYHEADNIIEFDERLSGSILEVKTPRHS